MNNVEKHRKRKAEDDPEGSASPRKRGRPKRTVSLESRYPKIPILPDNSHDGEKERALAIEMEKERPRKDIILPLMKETFYARRQYILHDEGSVSSKLLKYSCLKMPPVVSCV